MNLRHPGGRTYLEDVLGEVLRTRLEGDDVNEDRSARLTGLRPEYEP